ncbi:methyltransferase domain-containing protein [Sulfolobus sp. E5-1-F]|uniref:class I SAM-dependent methyltransferase n=1 Tax=Sulfolobaceae TaxID=118883 RepID=UPI001294E9F7|nr:MULTISPECIES: class I SAM-dependent methyltransferase [unclassified Sulfolobus]QGA54584.1 methyltransferase domain-containing protein [Sulfolobus sp. E5-1-F]QGA67443.1 methyltransferase domain-containing protein [Sulfolobus sp. E11-6]
MIFSCPIDGTDVNEKLECEKGHKFNIIEDKIYDFLLKDIEVDKLLERITPIYENVWAPLGFLITSGKTYVSFLREIGEFIDGDLIVDVGTGTGKIFDFLTCKTCIGIDVSLRFLMYMKRKRPKVIAVRADANNLPLKSGVADGISSTLVLHMLPNPSFAIREISRVLKSNGKCSIAVLANVNSLIAKILSRWWKVNLRHYDYYMNLLQENSLKVIERKELGPWEVINCIKIS